MGFPCPICGEVVVDLDQHLKDTNNHYLPVDGTFEVLPTVAQQKDNNEQVERVGPNTDRNLSEYRKMEIATSVFDLNCGHTGFPKPPWNPTPNLVETVFHSKEDALNFLDLISKLTGLKFSHTSQKDNCIDLWMTADKFSFIQMESFRGHFIRFICSIASKVTINFNEPTAKVILEQAERNETTWASIGFLRYYCENLLESVGILTSDDWSIYALASELVSRTVVNELSNDENFLNVLGWISTLTLESEATMALDLSSRLMSVAVGEIAVVSFKKTALKTWHRRQAKKLDPLVADSIWATHFSKLSKKRYNKKRNKEDDVNLNNKTMASRAQKILPNVDHQYQQMPIINMNENDTIHPIQCPQCWLHFSQITSLQKHLVDFHQENLDRNFRIACVRCGDTLSNVKALAVHRQQCAPGVARYQLSSGPTKRGRKPLVSSGGMKFHCTHCQREFDSSSAFDSHHQRAHKGCESNVQCARIIDRRFVCRKTPCGYIRFNSWEELQCHFLSTHYEPSKMQKPIVSFGNPEDLAASSFLNTSGPAKRKYYEAFDPEEHEVGKNEGIGLDIVDENAM